MQHQTTPTNNENANDKEGAAIKRRRIRITFVRALFVFGVAFSAIIFIGALVIGFLRPKDNSIANVVKGDNLVLDKPTFVGHSVENGRVTVTAKSATRPLGENSEEIILTEPVMTTQYGSNVKAKKGVWHQTSQELYLQEDVEMLYANGDKANAKNAYYGRIANQNGNGFNLVDPIVYINSNVIISRKSGETLESNSAIWNEKSQELLLGGNAHIDVPNFPVDTNDFVSINIANGRAVSKSAKILADAKIIYGSGGTSLQFGKISASAQSYEFHSETKRIILRQNAHATFSK